MIIGPDSSKTYRQAVRLLAEDFANFTHFSPTPYEVNEAESYGKIYERDRVLLFSKPVSRAKICCFGSIGMRWEKYKYTDMAEGEGWFMTWAWFHPAEQRKGHLRNAWPHILRLFPDFMPLPPATPAMVAFLKQIGFSHPGLLNREFPIRK